MEQQAFGERVRACQTKMYRISVSIMGNDADAEDAAAEAVLRAWAKRNTLREEAYFETWLTRILINTCREFLRKKRAHITEELTDAIPAKDAQEQTGLREALMRVDEKYRLPLIMHHALGMSISSVAQALRLPEGVVRWRVEKGRKLMKQELEREEME